MEALISKSVPHENFCAPNRTADNKVPLRILYVRVIDWALTKNFASFLDIDRAVAKHLERMDQIVYSAARLDLSAKQVRKNFTIYPTKSKTKLHFFKDAYQLAFRLHKRHRYDLIYTDDPMWAGLVGYLLKRRLCLPLLTKCHSDYYSSTAWRRENPRYYIDFLLSLWLIRRADWITTVTRPIADSLLQLGVRPECLTVVPTLIRTGLFHKTRRKSVETSSTKVLFVGRLEKQKGLPYLIQAIAILARREVPVALTLAGDGSLQVYLKQLVRRLRIENRICFLGYLHHKQLLKVYQRHSFLVLSSLHEGNPKVIVEAGLCDLPAIGTRVGGIPELIVSGSTGLLVPPGNALALAAAIATLVRKPALSRKLGRQAAEKYRHRFAFPLILKKQLETFAHAAGRLTKCHTDEHTV